MKKTIPNFKKDRCISQMGLYDLNRQIISTINAIALRTTVIIAMLCCYNNATFAQTFDGGDGSETTPYLISSVAALQQLAESTSDYEGIYFSLTTDLDLSNICGENIDGNIVNWKPIGASPSSFKGTFDGNGHTISNLYIYETEAKDVALFGTVENGTIQNLNMVNTNITNTNEGNTFPVASIVAWNNKGNIINCTNIGTIKSNCNGDEATTGGIVGFVTKGNISNCTNAGDITGKMNLGGIVGATAKASVITGCSNASRINGEENIGGIVGQVNMNATITYCINTGDIIGQTNVGAIVGINDDAKKIANCYYDKQMCIAKGIQGADVEEQAEGKLTLDMTSGTLFNDATLWNESKGRYPIPVGSEAAETSIMTALPVFLTRERYDFVTKDFKIGTNANATWTVSPAGIIKINDKDVSIIDFGDVKLSAIKDGIVYRKITLTTFFAPRFDGGNGAETEPYLISSIAALLQLVESTFDYEDEFFSLTKDLDLSSICGENIDGNIVNWKPIGTEKLPFKGTFNGNGHTISNLYIYETEEKDAALFGAIKNGTIKNLNLVNTNITNISDGYYAIASFVAYNDGGTIISCTNIGTLKSNGDDSEAMTGGIVGFDKIGTIINCTNAGEITGILQLGGIAGVARTSTIIGCNNASRINGEEMVGGIAGATIFAKISHCTNTSTLIGKTDVGGIVGNVSRELDPTTKNCYYDKQMCIAKGIQGEDIEGQSEGKLTSEMTSGALFNDATIWNETKGLYPIPFGTETAETSIMTAMPVFLNRETYVCVSRNFTVATGNDVTWTASPSENLNIDGKNVTILKYGNVELTATKGGIVYKTISLTTAEVNPEGVNDYQADNIRVYPNPTVNGFYVDTDKTQSTLVVSSIDGKQIIKQPIANKTYIDLSNYASGIYIVKVNSKTFKIRKNR